VHDERLIDLIMYLHEWAQGRGLTCADMDHLVFLPAGGAALTRRAKKASTLSAVVVRLAADVRRCPR
jgi:hypothetical protein